ncbi:hypothetical protein M885DRAFT_527764 [Pelagophyceae sp. CCMP2097]|nr:hypothetical protein M885DRAFT_527764 [Pelagophyceae sp. CCMP2097]
MNSLLVATLLCARGARVRAVSLDEVKPTDFFDAMMDRAFPLARTAIPWSAVDWRRHSKIIVSGPQRSGTTFFASALARHLGYKHVDEFAQVEVLGRGGASFVISVSSGIDAMLQTDERLVLQRPQWSHTLHNLPGNNSEIFVAFLARNCLDVFRSQNRIMSTETADTGWTCKYGRRMEWLHYHTDAQLLRSIESEHDMICTIKQQAYRNYQRVEMDRKRIATAPISYKSFKTLNDTFKSSSFRSNLAPKQIAKRA